MTSLINTTAIDITYPVAGQDNDTQGFRTNFGSIANNLSIAASEITTLQTTVATLGELPVATSEVFYQGTGIAGSGTFATGSRTITLAGTYGSVNNIKVHFDGVYQGITSILTLIGNVLTFVDPIPAGVGIVFVDGGIVQQVSVPPTGSVGVGQLAPDALAYFQAQINEVTPNSEVFTIGTGTGKFQIGGTSITLAGTYGTLQNIKVHFGVAYVGIDQLASLVGHVLTFSTPIPSWVTEIYVDGGTVATLGVPAVASIGVSQLAPDTITYIQSQIGINTNPTSEVFSVGTGSGKFQIGGTVITLAGTYGSLNNIRVYFDAAYQGINQLRSLVGNVLTFMSPIPTGVINIYVDGGNLTVVGIPSNGTVGLAQLAPDALNYLASTSGTAPSFTGPVTISSTNSANSLIVTDTGVNGANIKLVGNGPTTPNKFIRSQNGAFQIINSAYTTPLLTIDDVGNLTAPTSVITPTIVVNAITNTGQTYNTEPTAGIEHGSTTIAGTPFIDFHSSGNANDYDSRIIANGGTTNGTGNLSVLANTVTFNGNVVAATMSAGAFTSTIAIGTPPLTVTSTTPVANLYAGLNAPLTSGYSILYGNGSGGFSPVSIGSGLSFNGGALSASGTVQPTFYVQSAAPISTQPYYTSNGVTQISTVNATNNWILNVGYSSGVSLNSQLAIGNLIEINFYMKNGATSFFQTAFQIDGVAVTPQWDGGAAPTSGDANSTDLYTYKILKTGNAVYSVFGSVKQFK